MICTTKLDSHPENTVGLLTSAGKSARILVTSTQDVGLILASLHDVKFDGSSNLLAAIQKAQLALKHRQNQAQRQRIVIFVSSPVEEDKESLVKLGKKLKKNNVAVDIINVGEDSSVEKLDALIEAVNSNNNSHVLHVQAGPHILADLLMSSDIMIDREAVAAAAASGGGESGSANTNEFPFGVDPNVDPDLAMVLRISAEEERARQEAQRQAASSAGGNGNGENGAADQSGESGSNAAGASVDPALADDVDLYGTQDGKMEVDTARDSGEAKEGEAPEDDDEEMDESMRAAIALSKEDFKEGDDKK